MLLMLPVKFRPVILVAGGKHKEIPGQLRHEIAKNLCLDAAVARVERDRLCDSKTGVNDKFKKGITRSNGGASYHECYLQCGILSIWLGVCLSIQYIFFTYSNSSLSAQEGWLMLWQKHCVRGTERGAPSTEQLATRIIGGHTL